LRFTPLTEHDGLAGDAVVGMARGIGLRNLDGVSLPFSDQVGIDLDSQNGGFGADSMELTFLLGSFQGRALEESLHIHDGVVAVGQGRAGRRRIESRLLLAQDLQRTVDLLVGDRPCVGLERNGIRSFIVAEVDLGLDFYGGGEGEGSILLDLHPFQRRNFHEHGADAGLPDGAIVEIGHETADDVFFNRLGIALFENR
jgi:hypothetical protein